MHRLPPFRYEAASSAAAAVKLLAAGLAALTAATLSSQRAVVHVGAQPTGLAAGAGSLWSANSAGRSRRRGLKEDSPANLDGSQG